MPEGTIFQEQNFPPQNNPVSAQQPPGAAPPVVPAPSTPSPKPSPRRLIKLGAFLLVILTVLFLVLGVILPKVGKSSDKTVTLSYWGIHEDPVIMGSVISDFEKENPTIKINYTKEDPKDYREKLATRIHNGNLNAPDIFEFHNSWYPMFYDLLLPLPQETISKKEFVDNYYGVAQTDLIKNGAIYGIPFEMDTLAMYVNTKIFDDASSEQKATISIPTTWQEFIDASVKLTKRDDSGKIIISGAGIGTYENVNYAPDIISLLFVQNGVDLNNIKESSAKVSDALRFYTNFSLVETNIWDQTLDPTLSAFSQGKLAMFFGYSGDYFAIKSANPNLSFKVVPVPQLLNDHKVNIASYWADGISSKSKNQKETLLFMKFLAKKDSQQKIHEAEGKIRTFGQPYANKNLAEELRGTNAFVFVDQAKTAVSTPFVGGTFDNGLNDKLNEALKTTVSNILGGGDIDSATGVLLDSYFQVLGQYSPQPKK